MGLFDKKKPQEDLNAEHLQELLDTVNKLSSDFKTIQTVMDTKINGLSETIQGFRELQNPAPMQPIMTTVPEPEPRLEDLSDDQLAGYSRRELIMLQNEQSKKDYEDRFDKSEKSIQERFAKRDADSEQQQTIAKFKTFIAAKSLDGNLLYPDSQDWLNEVANVYKQMPTLELHEALNIAKGRNPDKRKQTDLKYNLNQPAPIRDAFGGFPGDSSSPTEESDSYSLEDASIQGIEDEVNREGGINSVDQ